MSRVGVSEGNLGIISRVRVKLVRFREGLARDEVAGSVSAMADFRTDLDCKAETNGVLDVVLVNPGISRMAPKNFLARSRRMAETEEPAY